MVFDTKLGYRFTITGDGPMAPVGPATLMAGRLLVPVAEGLGVYNPADGARERVIPLSHPPGTGLVMPAVLGQMVIEQRDADLARVRPYQPPARRPPEKPVRWMQTHQHRGWPGRNARRWFDDHATVAAIEAERCYLSPGPQLITYKVGSPFTGDRFRRRWWEVGKHQGPDRRGGRHWRGPADHHDGSTLARAVGWGGRIDHRADLRGRRARDGAGWPTGSTPTW